jgi:glycosyltransferase involved in cell wall biosynthesis
MKILMLTDFYPPTIGGVEGHVATLSEHLVKRGHDVAVCTVRQRGMRPFEVCDGVRVHRLETLFQKIPFTSSNPLKQFHPPFKDPQLTKQIERIAKDFSPDVIHSHGWIVFSYSPLRSKLDVPVVATLHHYGLICPRQDLFFRGREVCSQPLTHACYACCAEQYGLVKSIIASTYVKRNREQLSKIDKFLAVSSFVRDVHIEYLSIPDERISVIPNFCDTASERGSDYEDDLPDDFILYIGALMPHKGIDVLLEAYRLSTTDLPLVLMGSKHPDYDYRKHHDRKRMFVIENAPRSLLIEAYKKCEFAVIPSIWAEPCPTVALEAMACGKPVVASNVGGLLDIVVDHETGLLVPPGDAKSLSRAIKEMEDDQEMRSKMRIKARERCLELFSAEKVVRRLEEVYSALVHVVSSQRIYPVF